MVIPPNTVRPLWPVLAWSSAALLGAVIPMGALWALSGAADPGTVQRAVQGAVQGAIPTVIALALMSAGMIAASTSGRFWAGILASFAAALILILLSVILGLPLDIEPLGFALAVLLASFSFAARGALFARSAGARGWWVALGVVGGEAAVVVSALVQPDVWPAWLLALLPAQWATSAFAAVMKGTAAPTALTALGGTAIATLFVVRLWPARWTYGIMFTVWLGASALVYHAG